MSKNLKLPTYVPTLTAAQVWKREERQERRNAEKLRDAERRAARYMKRETR